MISVKKIFYSRPEDKETGTRAQNKIRFVEECIDKNTDKNDVVSILKPTPKKSSKRFQQRRRWEIRRKEKISETFRYITADDESAKICENKINNLTIFKRNRHSIFKLKSRFATSIG